MRQILFITLSLISITSNAQLILNQQKENASDSNILFSNYEHSFTVSDNIKLQEVKASVGNVYAENNTSFKYKMPVLVSKGKMKFTITYLENKVLKTEELNFRFIPKKVYSCKIIGAKRYKKSALHPRRNELSKEYFRNNDIKFEVFYDNIKINAIVKCAQFLYLPKRGEGAIFLIPFGNKPCSIVSNREFAEPYTLEKFKPNTGDIILIELLSIMIGNQEKQIQVPAYELRITE